MLLQSVRKLLILEDVPTAMITSQIFEAQNFELTRFQNFAFAFMD